MREERVTTYSQLFNGARVLNVAEGSLKVLEFNVDLFDSRLGFLDLRGCQDDVGKE